MPTGRTPFLTMATRRSLGKEHVNQGRKKITTRPYPDLPTLAINDVGSYSVPAVDPDQISIFINHSPNLPDFA